MTDLFFGRKKPRSAHTGMRQRQTSVSIKRWVLGVVFVLVCLPLINVVYTYTRAGEGARVHAATSSTLNFQARLMNASGALVADGNYSIQFKLYDAVTGGTNEWTETQTVVLKNGYFSAQLGAVTPFPGSIDWSQEKWLTMNVNADGEMNPRIKLTGVPFAFRSGLADALSITGGSITGDDLLQKAPGSVQSINSADAGLRMNQTGSGGLLQLQGNGADVLTVDKFGNMTLAGGLKIGNSTSTTAGTLRWTGTDFEGFNGTEWLSLTSGGGGGGGSNANASASFVSGLANAPANTTGAAVEMLHFTTATAVSNTVGSTGFIAPADGSFRTCLVRNNAAVTGGTLNLRWRVNGVSVGAAACTMNSTKNRESSGVIDPGVVTFSAGDNISIAFDTSGLSPTTADYTVYWTIEYNSTAPGGGGTGLEFVQDGNSFSETAVFGTKDNFGLNIITNNTLQLVIDTAGNVNLTNGDLSTAGTRRLTNAGALENITGLTMLSGSITGVTDITASGSITAGSFIGNGAGLTNLDASAIAAGTLNDARLSGNVVLLDGTQTFSGANTFTNGLTIGNTVSATAGTLRWTGTDFEGYNGTDWVSLTSGGGGGGSSLLDGVAAIGKVAANGSALNVNGASVVRNSVGNYTVTLTTPASSSNYNVQLTAEESAGVLADVKISITNQTINGFTVLIHEGNDASATDVLVDRIWHFIAFDPGAAPGGGGGSPSNAFVLNGNAFGSNAILGTTDNYGLSFMTNSVAALTLDNFGSASFANDVTINDSLIITAGGIAVTGDSSIAGALSGLTGLTVVSGGANITGGVDLNNGGLTNAGAIAGVTTISMSGAITAATSIDTINGLIINAGSLSGITGFSQSGGNFAITGTGTFSTGTGAISLSGATTVGSSLTVSGLATLNGGLTLEAGDTFTFNGEDFTDLTGNGLAVSANALGVNLQAGSGMTVATTGLTLRRDCSNNQLLKWANAGGGSWNCAADGVSDARLKTNIQSIDDESVLSRIRDVKLYSFDYDCANPAFETMHCDTDRQVAGVMAQELMQSFPELVKDVNGHYEVNYDALGLYNLKAVGELADKVDSLALSGTKNEVVTNDVLRMNSTGGLLNINGLTMSSGGASIVGGLNNNNGGITSVGALSGVTSITAQTMTLNATGNQNLLTLTKDGVGVFTVFSSGALKLQLDSAQALAVKTANGDNALTVDTLTGKIKIGSGNNAKTMLFVLDTKSTEGDPEGTNGAQYYNGNDNKMRCYEDNEWKDCIPTQYSEYTIMSTSAPWVQPNADTELPFQNRTWLPLRNAKQFRVIANLNTAGAQNAACRIQYATNTNTSKPDWHDLASESGAELRIDQTGPLKSEWKPVAKDAKSGDTLVRVMCSGGDGQIAPNFVNIRLQIF